MHKKTLSIRGLCSLTLLLFIAFFFSFSFGSAATPEEEFTFDQTTGVITAFNPHPDSSKDIEIPGSINGVPVTGVMAETFAGKQITSIVFPHSVEEIGEGALEGNPALTSVTLPPSLTVLPARMFYGCTSLEQVELPEDLEFIDEAAFAESGITSLTIEEGVSLASYGETGLFENCLKLSSLSLPEDLEVIPAGLCKGCSSLTSFTFPQGTIEIQDAAFENSGLTSLSLPEEIEEIGSRAFANTKLTSLAFPDSLWLLGDSAFLNIPTLTLPLSYPAGEVGDYCFSGCGVSKIIFPEDLTSLPKGCFSGCKELTELSLPDSLEELEPQVFSGCTSLEEVSLPASLTELPSQLFAGCTALKTLSLPSSLTTLGEGSLTGTGLTEITLPSSVTAIGDNAFSFCKNLASVTLSQGLITIGDNAFRMKDTSTGALSSLTIPASVTSIGANAFLSSLETLSLPAHTKGSLSGAPWGMIGTLHWQDGEEEGDLLTIEPWLYRPSSKEICGYTGTDVVLEIPASLSSGDTTYPVEGIACGTFLQSNLQEVTLEEGILFLGSSLGLTGAFQDCTALRKVTLPESLKEIRSNTFVRSCALTEVSFPSSLSLLGMGSFAGSGLTSLSIPASAPTLGYRAFAGCPDLTVVSLPSSGISSLVTQSGEEVFAGNPKLTKLIFSEDFSSNTLGRGMFKQCTGLEEVALPASVSYLPESFMGCTSLEQVDLSASSNASLVLDGTFAGCRNLTSLDFLRIRALDPEINNAFPTGALEGCGFTEIVFPTNVTEVGSHALAGCPLTYLEFPNLHPQGGLHYSAKLSPTALGDGFPSPSLTPLQIHILTTRAEALQYGIAASQPWGAPQSSLVRYLDELPSLTYQVVGTGESRILSLTAAVPESHLGTIKRVVNDDASSFWPATPTYTWEYPAPVSGGTIFHFLAEDSTGGYTRLTIDLTPTPVPVSPTPGDSPKKGELHLLKTNPQGEPLLGAVFQIIDKTDQSVLATLCTDETGCATSPLLPLVGVLHSDTNQWETRYLLVETEAPKGYRLDATPHPIVFSWKEDVTILSNFCTIINEKEEEPLHASSLPSKTPEAPQETIEEASSLYPQTGDSMELFFFLLLFLGSGLGLFLWFSSRSYS